MEPHKHNSHLWILGRTRIRDKSGYTGTVVYVGPVASAADPTETWLGIVWDDVTRGKHDGSVISRKDGSLVRHFQAPHPTAGSFVRPKSVDLGIPLTVELLQQRYVTLNSPECVAPQGILPYTARTVSGRNDKVIEFCGELQIRKQQQLSDLTTISLRLAGISSIPADGQLKQSMQHLLEIDLAGNLLSDWSQVANLLKGVPQLQKLSLASNRLGDVAVLQPEGTETAELLPSSPSLTHLNLRQTNLQTVESLIIIGQALNHLQELSIAQNFFANMSRLDANALAQAYPHLTLLDCSQCGFTNSDPILAWSQLPVLESLSLDDNEGLSDWQGLDPVSDFQHLQHLQVTGTAFDDWTVLTKPLQALPHLERLRLRSCPLLRNMGVGQARMATIGYLPRLQVLNATKVTETERRDAARWYVLRTIRRRQEQQEAEQENEPLHHDDKSTANKDGSAVETNKDDDPQYVYWTTHYPQLLQQAHSKSSTGTTTTLIESVVSVTIRSMAANSCTMDPLVRRLPQQLTVGRLKALCSRHFGLDIDLQALYFTSSPNDAFPTAMDCDDHTLAYYGIPDGAEILMNELDVEAMEREKQRVASELESRMEQQEREMDEFRERQQQLASHCK